MFLEKATLEFFFFFESNFENAFWMLEQPVNNKVPQTSSFS